MVIQPTNGGKFIGGKRVPNGYREVEYIAPNKANTTICDLKFIPKYVSTMRLWFSVQNNESSYNAYFMETGYSNSFPRYNIGFKQSNIAFYINYKTTNTMGSTMSPVLFGQKNFFEVKVDYTKAEMNIDLNGSDKYLQNTPAVETTSVPVTTLKIVTPAQSAFELTDYKVFEYEYFDDSTKVHLIPCRADESMSNTFFYDRYRDILLPCYYCDAGPDV